VKNVSKELSMLSRFLRRWFDSPRTKPWHTKRRRRLFLEPLEDRSLLSTFTVTNTDASGPDSLFEAIYNAENTPNVGEVDRIEFNIPASDPGHVYYRDDGVAGQVTRANVTATANADDTGIADIDPDWAHSWYTIFPAGGYPSAMPVIHDAVIIDGYTQPGASPNTLAVGDDAKLLIEINASSMGPTGGRLFGFTGGGSTVRGLAITHVPGASITLGLFGGSLPADHTTIVGNFIGTDADGLNYEAGDGPAIQIVAGDHNVIGGPAPADRNVIAPGAFGLTATIDLDSGISGDNVIQGNYIGVNKDGTAPLQGSSGGFAIGIGGPGGNTIGGLAPGEGNVIHGNGTGIRLTERNGGHNKILGNLLGTNATGTAGFGGFLGIDVQSSNDEITGNLISGFSTGININPQGFAALEPGPTIRGNKIGTDITGTLAIPNSGDGIYIARSPDGGMTIGGTDPGDGNTIANSGRYGVFVNSGTGCSILRNSIFANGNLGINLNGSLDGFTGPVTPNDPGDGDGDANGLQNFPVLTSASAGSSTTVVGTLNSTPNTTFRIEFFASDAADPTGFGEGQTFLDFTTVTTDGNGDASFTVTLQSAVAPGQVVTATATDPAGNTSEFALTIAGQVTNTAPVITRFDGDATGLVDQQVHYLAVFHDPDADTWTGTVNWGDGTSDQLAVHSDGLAIYFHTYLSPGTFSVSLTVADNHGNSDTRSLDVTVAAPTNTPPVITSFTAPASFQAVVEEGRFFGIFSDPDPNDTWTGTINFGDGTGDKPLDLNPNKTFSIYKTYTSAGAYTVTATIADDHGSTDTRSLTVTITDNNTPPVVTITSPSLPVGLTGQPVHVTGFFTDPDTDAWTGTVKFGDGSGDQPLALDPDKTFAVDHVYASGGSYPMTVTVADNHGGVGARSLNLLIDTRPVMTVLDGPTSGLIGQSLHFTGAFTDPDADSWTGTVRFDDFTFEPLTLNPDKTFAFDHTYADPGSYEVDVRVNDNHVAGSVSRQLIVNIDTPPVVTITSPSSSVGLTGQPVHIAGHFTDSDADTWTATVNFGDGSGDQPLALNPDKTFAVDHTYANSGEYHYTVSIADNRGGVGVRGQGFFIDTLPVITSLDGPTTGLPGQSLHFTGVFTDPDADAWIGAVISTDTIGSQPLILNSDKTFTFDHTFANPGSYTLSVVVADNFFSALGTFGFRTLTVNIDTPPVITDLNGPTHSVPGQPVHFAGLFTDPDPADTWTGTVNFGDGSGGQPLVLNPDKSFAFDHAYANVGSYNVGVTVTDNHGGVGTRSLVVGVNNPPVITSLIGPTSGRPGQTLQFSGSFSDPDADSWTGTVYVFHSGCVDDHEPLVLNPDKTFSFSYVFDGCLGTWGVIVTVTDSSGGDGDRGLDVSIINGLPVARDDTALLNTAASATINVLANDSDPDGDTLTVRSVTQPASGHGTVTINADGTLTYKQTVFVNGTETFTYTITDGFGETATATATVTVNLPARVGIDMLLDQVRRSGLSRGQQNSLIAQLNAAQQSLAGRNPRLATKQLNAFADEVRALKRSHHLAANTADLWLLEVENILAAMGQASGLSQSRGLSSLAVRRGR
jgi:hypothetical protein